MQKTPCGSFPVRISGELPFTFRLVHFPSGGLMAVLYFLESKMKPNTEELTRKKRFSKALILQILGEHDMGQAIEDICKRHAIKEAQFYRWHDLYRPERYNVRQKLESLEKELKQYKRALLLQVEQIRVLNETVHNKFKE